MLGKRSIKTTAKAAGIRLAISMIDLTTLEGQDTPARCASSARGRVPVAAPPRGTVVRRGLRVPVLVRRSARALAGAGVKVASVATGFPSGQTSLDVKLEETARRSPPARTRSTW